ncbi:hypothetical protein AB1Y20_011187 [Prymnesium parvum]|uniref:Tubulin--tyrosine ligase-like protein 9 n=1 Tax=Prymnesium parvum TaxID=97485 RepID=A0AB34INU0_PRYPA
MKVRVCLDDAKKAEEVVRLCIEERNFLQVPAGKPCALLWIGNAEDSLHTALETSGAPLINRLPGLLELAHKERVPFTRLMARVSRVSPAVHFVPRAWVLPDEAPALERALASGVGRVIVKPDGGSQGDGVFLAARWADVAPRAAECLVAQAYVPAPLTLRGLKFDVRAYVLLECLSPLRVHLCRDGLARFATAPYDGAPARKLTAHLTNYSLNVRDAAYEHNDDPHDGARGSKRSLRATLAELERTARGFDASSFWSQLEHIAAATCVALQPSLLHAAARLSLARRAAPPSARCFALLGFDVLVDEAHRLHLLEVNSNPSLQARAPPAPLPITPPARGGYPPAPPRPHLSPRLSFLPFLDIDVCEAAPADLAPPTKGSRLTAAAHGAPCRCMEFGGAHVHRRCLVDEAVKRAAVGGAIDILLRRPSEAYTDLAAAVGAAQATMGSIDRARRAFEKCMDRRGVLTSTRARKLLRAAAGFGSAEADIAFLRAKHAALDNEVGLDAFIDMLLRLCESPPLDAGDSANLEARFSDMLGRIEEWIADTSTNDA